MAVPVSSCYWNIYFFFFFFCLLYLWLFFVPFRLFFDRERDGGGGVWIFFFGDIYFRVEPRVLRKSREGGRFVCDFSNNFRSIRKYFGERGTVLRSVGLWHRGGSSGRTVLSRFSYADDV